MSDELAALPRRALLQLTAWRTWPVPREALSAPRIELAQRLGAELAPAERARLAAVRLRPGREPFHRELLMALLGAPPLDYALSLSDERTLARAADELGAARAIEGAAPTRRRALAAALRARSRGLVLPALGFVPDSALSAAELGALAAARAQHRAAHDQAAAALAAEIVSAVQAHRGQRLSSAGVPEADKGKLAQAFERRVAAWTGREPVRGAGPDFGDVELKAVPLLRGPSGVRPADAKIKLCGIRVEPRDKLRHVVWAFYWKDDDTIAGAAATFWDEPTIESLFTNDGIVEAPAGASGAGQRALYLRSRILGTRTTIPTDENR